MPWEPTGIPDPTTAGDFCRRFVESDVMTLMDTINQVRLAGLGPAGPLTFLRKQFWTPMAPSCRAALSVKRGMDFTYDGQYGFHPLLIFAGQYRRTAVPVQSERQPPLARAGRCLLGQSGHALPPGWLPQDPSARGDTKFAQTRHLDRWDDAGDIRFPSSDTRHTIPLEARADELPAEAYSLLKRPQRHPIKTTPREKLRAG